MKYTKLVSPNQTDSVVGLVDICFGAKGIEPNFRPQQN